MRWMSETCSASATVSNPPSRPSGGRSKDGSWLPSQSRTVFSYSVLVSRLSGTVPAVYAPIVGTGWLPPPGPPMVPPPPPPIWPVQAPNPRASSVTIVLLIGNITILSEMVWRGVSRAGWYGISTHRKKTPGNKTRGIEANMRNDAPPGPKAFRRRSASEFGAPDALAGLAAMPIRRALLHLRDAHRRR